MTDPTDADRYPTLTEDGRRMLQFMREHEFAPIFRNQSGNRLTPTDLDDVAKFEATCSPRRYLDAMAPEIVTGDPISFAALLDLPVTIRPKALVSVAMALVPGCAKRSRTGSRARCWTSIR